jgi:DNA-directed RNA polymerase subunit M/transcription elongation factor TFIIS
MDSDSLREKTRNLIQETLLKSVDWQQVNIETLEATVRSIESSCHNANVDKAREKNIPTYWQEEQFVEQYSNIVYKVIINIDPESSINTTPKDGQVSLIRRILLTQLVRMLPIHETSMNIILDMIRGNHDLRNYDPLNHDLLKIGYMSSIELNPHINQHILDEIANRSAQIVNEKTTEMYLCSRCKQRKTKYRKAQTRSGDEGYTIFIECQVCGFKWTIY